MVGDHRYQNFIILLFKFRDLEMNNTMIITWEYKLVEEIDLYKHLILFVLTLELKYAILLQA